MEWRRIETLVVRALELAPDERETFFAQATADDPPSVRDEVRSLVHHATTDPGFLGDLADAHLKPIVGPALDELGARAREDLEIGSILLDRYRIEDHLGAGGMGTVFEARDTRLERRVALKVLPWSARADRVARERFVLEARAVSDMDHPNVATVHDIVTLPDGRDCIVMARYEGATLDELLADGPLDPEEVVRIAREVADGLVAAHLRGVIHCDVKPGNLLLTDTGVTKILDFGVARVGSKGGPRRGTSGTLPYMAPEQLDGQDVSPATDIWGLGVTVYELATGRRPFTGVDVPELRREIREDEPLPPSRARPGLPADIDAFVARALARDPEHRFERMEEVAEALDRMAAERRPSHVGSDRTVRLGSVGTVSAIVGLVAVTWLVMTLSPGRASPEFGRPRPLSSEQGTEDFASWSPEADAILYQAAPGGEVFGGSPDVLLRELDSTTPRNLTGDHEGFDGRPAWSPTGDAISFYSDRDGGGYFVMDFGGGDPRRVWSGTPLGGAHNVAGWSPTGDELAITNDRDADGPTLEIVGAADGGLRRRVPLPARAGNLIYGTAWSPDGRLVALADAMNLTPDESQLWVVRLADGTPIPITDGSDLAWSPSWGPDSRTLFFVSDRGGGRDLWVQSLREDGRPDGEPVEVTTGIGMRNAQLSRDGSRLAYSQGRIVAHVWKVPILPDRPATWNDAEQVTSDRAYVEFVDVDPASGQVYVSSDRSGGQDLWRFDRRGSQPERISASPASDWAPALSPDRRRLAFYSARTGDRELWLHDLESGVDERLTRSAGIDFVPSWSPRGDALVYASGRRGNLDVWVLDLASGQSRALTTNPAMDAWPHWSPRGDTIVFRSNRDGRWRLWAVSASGGPPTPVTEVSTTYFRWSPTGEELYLVSGGQIWLHDRATGEERPLTALDDRPGSPGVVALATDGESIWFTWEEDIGDLWTMERIR